MEKRQGSIDITVSGGTGILLYDWSNSETSEDLYNIVGTYIAVLLMQIIVLYQKTSLLLDLYHIWMCLILLM